MWPVRLILCFLAITVTAAAPALSDTPASTDLSTVWECPQPDGVPVYTNIERPGCIAMQLKPLSTVPSLPDLAPESRLRGAAGRYDVPLQPEGNIETSSPSSRAVPDWAGEWYANISPSGSTREEACAMYSEWIRLNERSRGGFYFGTDPSYGSDPSGHNRRGPSYSFYDNARWVTLAKLFGTGFVPVGCP